MSKNNSLTESEIEEIKRDYERSSNKRNQIKILSELYDVDKSVIESVLGFNDKKEPEDNALHKTALDFVRNGGNCSEFARQNGLNPHTVSNWIRKYIEEGLVPASVLRTPKKRSKELKEEVIRYALECGKKAEAARKYNVHETTVGRWVKEFKSESEKKQDC